VPPQLLVSIVTPCLNPGERLVRCLDSISAQSYRHIEHIVVDGGSTDGTVELLEARGIRFVSEADRGQTDAINKGFALARGDLLGWLNGDDVLVPRATELAVAALASVPGAGWVYGDNTWRDGAKSGTVEAPPRLDVAALARGTTIPQSGALVARWALDRIGPLDESLELAMDYDLWLRLLDAGIPYARVAETLAEFEVHAESKSGSIDRSEFWFEWAAVLANRGHPREAALMFGRAAAGAASRSGRSPGEEIGAALERAGRFPGLDSRLLRGAAYAEAALLDLHRRPRRYRNLLRPAAWRAPELRSRLAGVAVNGARKRLLRS
jgi:Glycosyl transferase family 2